MESNVEKQEQSLETAGKKITMFLTSFTKGLSALQGQWVIAQFCTRLK